MSATVSICFAVLLAPWPDLVSIRMRIGVPRLAVLLKALPRQ